MHHCAQDASGDPHRYVRLVTTSTSAAVTTGMLTPVSAPPHTANPSGTASVVSHHQARSSVLATVSLVVAVLGALTTLTGVLAAPGAVLGLVAALFGVGGITATRQRHVTGTGNAIIGVTVGLISLAAGEA